MLFSKVKYISRNLISVTKTNWVDLNSKMYSATSYSVKDIKDITENKNDIKKSELRPKVTKLDFNDQSLSKILLQIKSKKMRSKSNLIFFEGKRVLKEAIEAGVLPVFVFFSRRTDLEGFDFPASTKLLKMPYNEMKVWSSLTTAPGILAVCKKPDIPQIKKYDIPVTIICDNVREPGNLGALIRSAAGAGVKNVVLSKGCVDLWDSKVIRGGAGSQFQLPIHNDVEWSEVKNYLSNDTLLLLATNKHHTSFEENKNAVPYSGVKFHNHSSIGLIIGGETEGVSENAYNLLEYYKSKLITIPLSNGLESLNCVSALSIILFEIKRQMMCEHK